ncbi:uncharacterized protein E0L32_002912 [Thyridium curvatum]|uniref:Uncharacterized protein n=1 Tax=Thyridium curvatum TaxID=1093900 RepID=A0A507BKZ4_9PEZI|nr:uncharacterized protein E0L32_002912 [Thyridium curvatum]TPX17811.1 hypothetical protein E0L32_002912 [Thyridium curvatum]
MAFSRAERERLGSIVFLPDAAEAEQSKTERTSLDGSIKIRLHQNAQSVVSWFKNFQVAEPQEEPAPKRKFSVAAVSGERPAHSPSLNIVIHIVGSRGDVQPFIPIAQTLSRPPYNHRVRICTHPVFKDFVEEHGLEFFSIGGDPSQLMAYMVRNPGLLPSRESMKAGDVGKRRKEMWDIMTRAWRSCIEAGNGLGEPIKAVDVANVKDLFLADAIIANPPSMAHIHCAEKLGIPLHMVFTMPWSPTTKFPHPLASIKDDGGSGNGTLNYFSFILMELLTWQGLGDLINKFRIKTLGLDPVSPMWGHQLLHRLHVPYSYLWSQSLIPKPADWGPHINITGFSFLPLAHSYTPSPDLAEFLDVPGPAPIYIGFGSIVVDDPQALTAMIFQAVKLAGVRAIVSKGWGGIGSGEVPKDVFLIDNVPHDWLFQHVSAVVHHGGAGTTAAGIAAGRPTVVVPFFGDQPFWGKMIAQAGAGPVPIPFKRLTAETLAASIEFALKPEVKVAVQKMADGIASEDGASSTAEDFQNRHCIDQMRCDLCPEKLAVWRHKKTGAHLSGFAASALVRVELICARDLKPLRHAHWYVDEGAEHPIVGVIAAGSLLFTCLADAGKEYRTRLKNRPRTWHPPAPTAAPDAEKNAPGKGASDQSNQQESVSTATDADHADAPIHATRTRSHVFPPEAEADPPTYALRLTQTQMETIAFKVANKSLKNGEVLERKLKRQPTLHERRKAGWKAREEGRYGKAFYLARATGRFAADIVKSGLRAPVALVYNVANGFHNYPPYRSSWVEARRRGEITGLGSGLQVAGTEFVLGFYDAFSGVVVHPYNGFKKEGGKGLGKGVLNAGISLVYNIGAAVTGLPGYTLKGFEKAYHKQHLTKLRAELLLIRLRQAIQDCDQASQVERDAVVERWKSSRGIA